MVARILCLILTLLLLSCNVYNPSGEASPTSAEEWLAQGHAQLRAREFARAQESFGHVLAQDSASTQAWQGYLKALSGGTLDLPLLAREVLDARAEGRKPLWDMPLPGKDSAYRSIIPVWEAMGRWRRLDSLGRSTMPSCQKTEFGMITLAHSMLTLWDYNQDSRIDSVGDRMALLLFGGAGAMATGSFKPSLELMSFTALGPDGKADTSGRTDPEKIAFFNGMLQRAGQDLSTLTSLAGNDSLSELAFSTLKGHDLGMVDLYRISDAKDNDQDGCADEEILDSLDNDGDGLIDEDARAGFVRSAACRTPDGGTVPGCLAQRSLPDGIRGDRLANAEGNGLPGQDSGTTLVYGDDKGHLAIFSPYWNEKDPRYPLLHWKRTCGWGRDSAQILGTTCSDGAPLDLTARLAINKVVAATPTGLPRARTGCQLLAGCWCRQLETLSPQAGHPRAR